MCEISWDERSPVFVNPRANPDRVVTTDFCLFQDAVWIILLDAATQTTCLSSRFFTCIFLMCFSLQFSAVYARTLATDPDIDSSLLWLKKKLPSPPLHLASSSHVSQARLSYVVDLGPSGRSTIYFTSAHNHITATGTQGGALRSPGTLALRTHGLGPSGDPHIGALRRRLRGPWTTRHERDARTTRRTVKHDDGG